MTPGRIWEALPRGRTLPDRAWRPRHHALLAVLWLHVAGLTAYALAQGHDPGETVAEALGLAAIAAAATVVPNRRVAASLVAAGLMTGSALVVHLSGGVIEAHFHFFVVLALVALYEDWVPFLVAIGYVTLHHGLIGAIDPEAIYDHPDAIANPWKWTAIHVAFVTAAAVAGAVAWRLNEVSRRDAGEAYRRASDSERSLREAQHLARVGSWEWDLDADRITWSQEMYRILGLDPNRDRPSVEVYESLLRPDDVREGRRRLQRAIDEGGVFSYDHPILRPDGTREVHARGEMIEEGGRRRVVGTLQDVSDRRRAEDEAARRVDQQAKVAALGQRALASAAANDLVREAATTVAAVLEVESAAVCQLEPEVRGFVVRAAVGYPEGTVGRTVPAGRASQAGFTVERGEPIVVEDWSKERRFGKSQPVRELGAVSGATVPIQAGGDTFGILGVQSSRRRAFSSEDVSFLQSVANVLANAIERQASEERIRHQALHDGLTGLPNRHLFLDRLGHALAKSERDASAVAVLFCDLDRFKLVNDSLGHESGDSLLRAVSPRLRNAMRPGDTVARFGGDEFGILVEDITSELDATHVAERVASALARPFVLGGREHFVTASIGIAIGGAGEMPEALIRDADAAMYRSKDRGGAAYEIFDEVMRARAVDHLEIENDLRRAVERSELRLHYQPVVRMGDGQVTSLEALVRWQHPSRGLIGPSEFVSIAEEGGLIVPVGHWILEQACRQAARWQAARPDRAPINVSVNLSARQVARPGLADEVAALLRGTGIDPFCLSFEITEGTLFEESAALLETVHALDDLGCRLLLDDFGTGFSSLRYLKRFPLDGIKVDRSFVERLGSEAADVAIVRAIVSMADELDLSVIAEGVETEGQMRQLRALGCGFAQGYYFTPPVPADEIGGMLDEPLRPAEARVPPSG